MSELAAPLTGGASTGLGFANGPVARLREGAKQARPVFRTERAVYLAIGLHALAAVGLLMATGQADALAFTSYLTVWPAVFFGVFPAIYGLLLALAVMHRLDRRRALAWRKVLSDRRIGHIAAGAAMLAALMIFQGAFTSLKNALPAWWGGFPFDVAQADIDRFLHGGTDPWLLLHAVGGNGPVRALVEWNYNQGWFIFCYGALFLIAVSPSAGPVRARYFLCYVATWIVIGNLLAGLFLSAGPAFYGAVTGDEARFAPLIDFLSQSASLDHSAARVQDYLWSLHVAGQAGIGSGISAFPSMHVGLVALNALFLAERGWRWGAAGFAYLALVLASSVYLGWHYAIDGYASILVTLAIYGALRGFGRPRTTAS